jgi:macrolide transport system ATP-binding/permease protein
MPWHKDVGINVRFGLRLLRKNPTFSVSVVFLIALAIGANTAIFSLLNGIMFRVLPISHPEQLVLLQWRANKYPNTHNSIFWGGCPDSSGPQGCSFSFRSFELIHAKSEVFSAVIAFAGPEPLSVTENRNAALAAGEFVSGDFFSRLNIKPKVGRMLTPNDDAPTASPVTVLSYSYWRRQFGESKSAMGEHIVVNGVPVTIVGVTAPGFQGLEPGVSRDLWLPFSMQVRLLPKWPQQNDENALWVQIAARLRRGVNAAQAESALDSLYVPTVTSPGSIFKPEDAPRIILANGARGLATLRNYFSTPLLFLMGAVALMLFLACMNIAGLVLIRISGRRKELALRAVLGATRLAIVRQILTESLILSGAGGALGVPMAIWGARALATFLSKNYYYALQIDVTPDLRVLCFTAALSILSGVIVGLFPAFRGTSVDLTPELRPSSWASGGSSCSENKWGRGLVIAQVAVTVALLTCAGLLVRTVTKLTSVAMGFDADGVLLVGVDTTIAGYRPSQMQSMYRELQERISSIPTVASVSYSQIPLLSGGNFDTIFALPGRNPTRIRADYLPVGPNFFETMRIPRLVGRTFSEYDFRSEAEPRPAVISRMLATRLFGNDNPVGRVFSEAPFTVGTWKVIGVVSDTKYDSLRKNSEPTAYIPLRAGKAFFELRTATEPQLIVPMIRELVGRVNGNLPLFDIRTQTEQVSKTLYQERFLASISSFFAVVALTLSGLGLYGLLSYGASLRVHEIVVRSVLGAPSTAVLRKIVSESVLLTLIGIVAGFVGSLALTRLISSILFEVTPQDPLTLVSTSILLILVALVACFLPAHRALQVDPMTVLRNE